MHLRVDEEKHLLDDARHHRLAVKPLEVSATVKDGVARHPHVMLEGPFEDGARLFAKQLHRLLVARHQVLKQEAGVLLQLVVHVAPFLLVDWPAVDQQAAGPVLGGVGHRDGWRRQLVPMLWGR